MTTILAVRKENMTVVGGDGQVTFGSMVMKGKANKIRLLSDYKVAVGFAGVSADAMALIERFEGMIKKSQGNLLKASVELAKEWRLDRSLRRLESMLLTANKEMILLISGNGDVIQPDDKIAAIGSGGGFALAAAKALYNQDNIDAKEIVTRSLTIAAEIDIHTNKNIVLEEIT